MEHIVSLLPPEIRQKRQDERRQALIIRAMVIFFLIVLVLYAFLLVSSIFTRNDIANLRSERETLEQQINLLQPYADLYNDMTAAEERYAQAIGTIPQWGDFLLDLGLTLPPGIWLSDMTCLYRDEGGTLNLRGWGYSHENIAEMLDRIQEMEMLDQVMIQTAAGTSFEGRDAVQFTVDALIVQEELEPDPDAETEEEES